MEACHKATITEACHENIVIKVCNETTTIEAMHFAFNFLSKKRHSLALLIKNKIKYA